MAKKLPTDGSVLGLDIGDKRIGLALASVVARLPKPIETFNNDEHLIAKLQKIIEQESISLLVVGVPRNLEGEETSQSHKIRLIGEGIARQLDKEIVFVDESFSSKRADNYLAQNKGQVIAQDSIAACFILDEFFITHATPIN